MAWIDTHCEACGTKFTKNSMEWGRCESCGHMIVGIGKDNKLRSKESDEYFKKKFKKQNQNKTKAKTVTKSKKR